MNAQKDWNIIFLKGEQRRQPRERNSGFHWYPEHSRFIESGPLQLPEVDKLDPSCRALWCNQLELFCSLR